MLALVCECICVDVYARAYVRACAHLPVRACERVRDVRVYMVVHMHMRTCLPYARM